MKKINFFTVLLCFSIMSFGQVQTAYEKKCYNLTLQLFKKLGCNEALLNKSNKISDLEGFFLMGDIIHKLNTEKGLMLLLAYNREKKEAENLKTVVDFQREKVKKEKIESEERLKQEKFEQEQAKIKQEQIEKERIKKYNNSDVVKITEAVKINFKTWLNKGEFEKTDEFEKRLKDECKEYFDKINYENIEQRMVNDDANLTIELKEYNADKEYFNIALKFKELIWNDIIKVSISNAPSFKENFGIDNSKTVYKTWGVYNNNLYPKSIEVIESNSNSKYVFLLPIEKLLDYNISTNSLGIQVAANDKIEFSLFDYQYRKSKAEEIERLEMQKKEEEKLRIATIKQKEQEEFKILQERQYKLERSDFGQLKARVKKEFEKWLIKSDFETIVDYQKRIEQEAKTKLNQIINVKSVLKQKNIYAKLDSYDSENERLIITANIGYDGDTYKTDTFFVSTPKNIAPKITQPILINQTERNRTSIIIVPTNIVMENNKWTLADAKVVLCVGCDCSCSHSSGSYRFKLNPGKQNLEAICEDAPTDLHYNVINYEVKSLKDFPSETAYVNGLFYADYRNTIKLTTSLDLTFENLGIVLPTFNK